jgi:peroxiredoxin
MRKKILVLILVLLLVVPIFVGCSGGSKTPGNTNNNSNNSNTQQKTNPILLEVSKRQVAPDFSWQDSNGKIVHLSDLKGKVVLIDFWATWCGPCRMTIPHVEAIYNKYKGKNVVVIGVNLDNQGSRQKVEQFIKEKGITYLVIGDPNGAVASQYGATSIPRFFFIDKHGRIAKMVVGYDPNMEQTFSEAIEALLKEN